MQKERFEWVHAWCDETQKKDLPRVLLIGDSITHSYQGVVRELLKGKCYVDYIATSYSINWAFYSRLIEAFAMDSDYAVIHFNHGLHGKQMATSVYEEGMNALAAKLNRLGKLIFVTSTKTYKPGTSEPEDFYTLVLERNEVVRRLAKEYNCPVDDLAAASEKFPLSAYVPDGTHFTENGAKELANYVVQSILDCLH